MGVADGQSTQPGGGVKTDPITRLRECRARHRWAITVVNDYDGVTILKRCQRCRVAETITNPESVRRELLLSRRRYLYRRRKRGAK